MDEYLTDNDIRVQNDNFWITRLVKYTLPIVVLVVICFITYLFIHALMTDPEFQKKVLDTVWQQIGTIIVSISAIIGISKYSK